MNSFGDLLKYLRSAAMCSAQHDEGQDSVIVNLNRLLRTEEWSSDDWKLIEQLSKKLDTTRRIDDSCSPAELDEPWRSVCALVLCQAFSWQLEKEPRSPLVLKRLNVAHKAIDYLAAIAPDDANKFSEALRTTNFSYLANSVAATPIESNTARHRLSTTLPLTVLFSEGPIARAYLETIASLGLRPRKIAHLISAVDVANGKENLPWLPMVLRKPIAAGMQRNRIFYWPNAIAKQHPDTVSAIVSKVAASFDFAEETIRQSQTNKPLIEYSDSVDTLLIENLRDPALLDYVDGETDKEFLYTGGGIVPATLLAVPKSRFVHIHPGFLPDIRGADGLLWSILTKRRPSASAFYMAPGIDTGDIIATQWLPEVRVHIDAGIDTLTRYRMAYALIDPWVRCRVLRELIESNVAFENIPATAQDEMDGTTYHFMHDQLRRMALDKLFGCA